jgi:poly-gamma-glutamate synthesis protein (capsule biosynthesis protein)
LIAADLVPTESNLELFNNGNVTALLGEELLSIWNSADIRIFNLEVPLADKRKPIDKCGPNLIAPKSTIKGIKALNPSLVTLANNHIMDQGVHGFNSTINILKEHKIAYVGAGANIEDAGKPYIIEQDSVKIGIYACAENEFSIVTENSPGANPFDPLESFDHIRKLKNQCNYVIVLYHGGKEHYRYPSPYLQKLCRKMVEIGASLVVCQHSHCVGAYENYKDSTIVYGQGNFIFNKHNNEFWNNSVIIDVKIDKGFRVNFIPVVTTKKGIRLANDKEKKEILDSFFNRSTKILDKKFVENKYEEFAKNNIDNYIRIFLSFGKWQSRIDRRLLRGFLFKKKVNKDYLLSIENFIECEAHRELLINGIKARRNDL